MKNIAISLWFSQNHHWPWIDKVRLKIEYLTKDFKRRFGLSFATATPGFVPALLLGYSTALFPWLVPALLIGHLKGIVSRDEYFFWRLIIINKNFLFLALMVFTILFHEKTKLEVWACPFGITYQELILEILPETRFKNPKVAILTLKMLIWSRLWFCKITPEAACDKSILARFPWGQWEVGNGEQ